MDRHSVGSGNGELYTVLDKRRRMVEGSNSTYQSPIVGSRSGASSAPTAARLPQHRLSAPGSVGTNGPLRPSPMAPRQLQPQLQATTPHQDHPYRQLSGGGTQVAPPPSQRERETMDRRMSDLMARNKELTTQVEVCEAKLSQGQSATFHEERNLLLQETDTLLAETDRMAEQSRQLEMEKDELGAHKANQDQLVFDLRCEVNSMRQENAEYRTGYSELTSEFHASTGSASTGSRHEHTECLRVFQAENEGLKKQTNELSLEVVNLKAKLQQQTKRADSAEARFLEASQAFQIERTELTEANERLKRELEQANELLKQGTLQDAPVPNTSEGRLRLIMSQPNSSSEDLKSAVNAVEAFLGEAQRELDRKLSRERRAAYEKLCSAIEKADDAILEAALLQAQKAGLDESDIKKGEEKLEELRSMTEEQKAAKFSRELESQRKANAFLLVKKDQAAELQAFIEGFEEGVRWMDWRDYAGRTLYKAAQELHAETVKALLARLLGIDEKPRPSIRRFGGGSIFRQVTGENSPIAEEDDPRRQNSGFSLDSKSGAAEVVLSDEEEDEKPIPQTVRIDTFCKQRLYLMYGPSGKLNLSYQEKPISETEEAELKTKAFRAVVKDDEDTLNDILESVAMVKWEKWKNKADKDLLTLSQERGSSLAYSVVAKAMGILKEQKRDTFVYSEAVWIYRNGDVQPRQATVKEDANEEVDKILVEYWDGWDEPCYVDRAFVRKADMRNKGIL